MLVFRGNKLSKEGSVVIAGLSLGAVSRARERNQRAILGGRLGAVRFIPPAGAGLDYGCVYFLRPHRSTVSIQDIETSSPLNGQAACRALLTALAPGKIRLFELSHVWTRIRCSKQHLRAFQKEAIVTRFGQPHGLPEAQQYADGYFFSPSLSNRFCISSSCCLSSSISLPELCDFSGGFA